MKEIFLKRDIIRKLVQEQLDEYLEQKLITLPVLRDSDIKSLWINGRTYRSLGNNVGLHVTKQMWDGDPLHLLFMFTYKGELLVSIKFKVIKEQELASIVSVNIRTRHMFIDDTVTKNLTGDLRGILDL